MSFAFDDVMIETRRGPRRALVMSPREDHLIGRERLRALRSAPEQSAVDFELVDHLRRCKEPYRVVIFRARSRDGAHRWRLEDTLDLHESRELTRRLALSQLPTWRALLRAGVWVMVHTDLGSSAAPMREGARELVDSPARLEGISEAVAEVDAWLLRHLVFFFSGNHDQVVEQTLPDKIPLVELRRDRIESLARQLGG